LIFNAILVLFVFACAVFVASELFSGNDSIFLLADIIRSMSLAYKQRDRKWDAYVILRSSVIDSVS